MIALYYKGKMERNYCPQIAQIAAQIVNHKGHKEGTKDTK